MDIRASLEKIIDASIAAARDDGSLELATAPEAALERPRDAGNGDWASTVAMRTAKLAGKSPRDIAQIIVDHVPENDMIASIEVAGPGFINIRLVDAVLHDVIRTVRDEGARFGRGEVAPDERSVHLEYISANPTGPMHVGHGRWAALGDATARVMRHAGYEVYEEFYINDHGAQMDNFGESVAVRYQQLLGRDVDLPEACYAGAYVADIAQAIIDEDGDVWLDADADERRANFRERAYRMMLDDQQRVCKRFGVTFDCWFSERTLYEPDEQGVSAIDRSLEAMREKGCVYERDGATWFASTRFGDDKDRVLIKANGEYTYFTSDVAYHYDKIRRGFHHLIDIWGADHHGYIARCEAMLSAWGYPDVLEVILGQLVNLYRDGKPVRMSKRTGEMVTFEELIDEVGVDATRFLMLEKSSDQQIDFDIEVAKRRDSTNPVYYVQYAHARICSVLHKALAENAGETALDEAAVPDAVPQVPEKAAAPDTAPQALEEANVPDAVPQALEEAVVLDEAKAQVVPSDVDLSPLRDENELALMRKMAEFPELVSQAAHDRAAYRLTHYAQDLASLFHSFYTECRILDEEENVRNARLALIDATRIVIALALGLLGVSAPARM